MFWKKSVVFVSYALIVGLLLYLTINQRLMEQKVEVRLNKAEVRSTDINLLANADKKLDVRIATLESGLAGVANQVATVKSSMIKQAWVEEKLEAINQGKVSWKFFRSALAKKVSVEWVNKRLAGKADKADLAKVDRTAIFKDVKKVQKTTEKVADNVGDIRKAVWNTELIMMRMEKPTVPAIPPGEVIKK